jgi:chromosome segregation ATPase
MDTVGLENERLRAALAATEDEIKAANDTKAYATSKAEEYASEIQRLIDFHEHRISDICDKHTKEHANFVSEIGRLRAKNSILGSALTGQEDKTRQLEVENQKLERYNKQLTENVEAAKARLLALESAYQKLKNATLLSTRAAPVHQEVSAKRKANSLHS